MDRIIEFFEDYDARIKEASFCFIAVAIMSAINVVLSVTKIGFYFLFSGFIPYYLTDMGQYLCGMYPKSYYDPNYYYNFYPGSIFAVMLALAIAFIVFYFLCFYFTRRFKLGWTIAGFIIFLLDTVAMFYVVGLRHSYILDYIFHIWIIFNIFPGMIGLSKIIFAPKRKSKATATNDTKTE